MLAPGCVTLKIQLESRRCKVVLVFSSSFLGSNVDGSTELCHASESSESDKDNPCNQLCSPVEPSKSDGRHLCDWMFPAMKSNSLF